MSDPKQNLQLDKRLIRRRGWIRPEDLERKLADLPDVADKIQPPEEPKPAGERGGSAGGGDGAA